MVEEGSSVNGHISCGNVARDMMALFCPLGFLECQSGGGLHHLHNTLTMANLKYGFLVWGKMFTDL